MRLLVFDSGIGGVGIASAIRTLLPQAALTYLMDDAGFPYGSKTEAALTQRVLQVVTAGIARVQPDLVVVACNTASTTALAA
jgi:glutamate racemase